MRMNPSDTLPSYEEVINERNLATEDHPLRINEEHNSTLSRRNIFEPTESRVVAPNLKATASPCIGPKYSICGNCKQFIKNKLVNKNNFGTYISDKILFIVGYFFCNCIPFFKYDLISSSKNRYVYCPNCNIYLGIPNHGILTNRSI